MNLLTARDAGCFFFNIYGKFILCEIIDKAGIIMYNKIIIIIKEGRNCEDIHAININIIVDNIRQLVED